MRSPMVTSDSSLWTAAPFIGTRRAYGTVTLLPRSLRANAIDGVAMLVGFDACGRGRAEAASADLGRTSRRDQRSSEKALLPGLVNCTGVVIAKSSLRLRRIKL